MVWIGGVMDFLATYVHDWDPVIWSITDAIKLRWYGLSYVLGFVAGYFILKSLSRRNLWVVKEEKVGDLLTWVAIFGVFLGGRLGYVLFYMIPEDGIGPILEDPLKIVAVWDGGMASHGGILGIMTVTLIWAIRTKVSWAALGDGFCIVAPLGVFFGRVANFINGELYGRKTSEESWWAVKFPKALYEEADDEKFEAALREAAVVDPQVMGSVFADCTSGGQFVRPPLAVMDQVVLPTARENPEVLQALGHHIPARHPSQLYEGILEGLVIFVGLYLLRVKVPRLWNGVITGLFFLTYAGFRILVENVREPDHELAVGGLTKGQFYSLFMIVVGVGFLVYAWKTRRVVGEEEKMA